MLRNALILFALFIANVSLAELPHTITQSMGKYVVSDVISKNDFHNGTVCKPYINSLGEHQGADSRCGQKLLAFRSLARDQIAFFQASVESSQLFNFSIFRGALLSQNRKCETSIAAKDLPVLFESDLCRGFLVDAIGGAKVKDHFDTYLFYPNMSPKPSQEDTAQDEAVARAVLTGTLTGLPLGVASAYSILVPKVDSNSKKIVIYEYVTTVVLFSKTTFTNVITLSPIE